MRLAFASLRFASLVSLRFASLRSAQRENGFACARESAENELGPDRQHADLRHFHDFSDERGKGEEEICRPRGERASEASEL